MSRLRFAPLVVAVATLLALSASADYLKVDRKAPIRSEPDSASDRMGEVAAGALLELLSEQQNGYYKVRFGEDDGWIYRSWVRRFPGSIPPPPTPAGSGTTSTGATIGSGAFKTACQLPFQEFATKGLQVDKSCAAEGTGSEGSKAQNRMKNFFCAKGPALALTFEDFATLQSGVDALNFPHGHNLPADRTPLKEAANIGSRKVGEGTLVRFAAFVMKAHHSNVSKGETVNCKLTGKDSNDVHIVLMKDNKPAEDQDECQSVTAEITPHYRPWFFDSQYILSLGRPLRFTGNLFYDAAHRPCRNGKGSPKRAASWEIHPVYGIDVCNEKTLAKCSTSDESKWTALHEFHNLEEDHGEGPGGS